MADIHDKKTRSFNMSRIRSRDTKPESLNPPLPIIFSNSLSFHLRNYFRRNQPSRAQCYGLAAGRKMQTLDWAEADWPVITEYQEQFDSANA